MRSTDKLENRECQTLAYTFHVVHQHCYRLLKLLQLSLIAIPLISERLHSSRMRIQYSRISRLRRNPMEHIALPNQNRIDNVLKHPTTLSPGRHLCPSPTQYASQIHLAACKVSLRALVSGIENPGGITTGLCAGTEVLWITYHPLHTEETQWSSTTFNRSHPHPSDQAN